MQMGEYEYHASPLDWHKPGTAPAKVKKGADLGVFRPPTVGRVGSLFNKIEVSSAPAALCANHQQIIACCALQLLLQAYWWRTITT